MADETLRIGITAELADFRKAMAELPDIGAQEARDMVNGIQRELRRAEAAAKASADGIGKNLGAGFDKASQAGERALGKLGGIFGEIADLTFDIVAPLGEMSVALGAIGGTAVAVGATAAAVVGLANAGVDALARLRELGVEIDDQTERSLDAYSASLTGLSTAWDELTVTLAAEVAPQLTATTQALTRLVGGLDETIMAARGFARELSGWASLGLTTMLLEYSEAAGDAAVSTQRLNAANVDLVVTGRELEVVETPRVQRLRDTTEAVDELAEMEREAREDTAAGVAEGRRQTAELQAREQAARDYADALREIETSTADLVTRNEALTAQWTADTYSNFASLTDSINGIAQVGFDAYIDSVQRRIDAGEEVSAEDRKRAREAEIIARTLAVTTATISAGAAIAGIIANQALLAGPFAIPTAIGAVAAAWTGTVIPLIGAPIGIPRDGERQFTDEEAILYSDSDQDGVPNAIEAKGGSLDGSNARTSRRGSFTQAGTTVQVTVTPSVPGRSNRGRR
jgi:hypothetical protein